MRRRVAIVAERAPDEAGGLAVASARIAGQAAARGDEVHVIAWSRNVAPGARARSEQGGFVLHRVGRLPAAHESLMVLTEHVSDVIREQRLELVHGIYAVHAGYAARVASSWHGLPCVVSVRGNDLDLGLFRAEHAPFVMHALSRATIVTGVSRALCQRASAVFERPVEYVPNSVDAEAFRPETRDNSLVASLGLGSDPVIGFLGELREKKGIRFLLPAFAELVRRRPATLLLIGGVRRDAEPALAAFRASAPDVMARVKLLEYARTPKRLSALLALCDVMVFPSLYEGMPNALLEAMAAGRPVLATAVGGQLDLIQHGKNGALLALSELDRLPDALEEFLSLSAEARRDFGTEARKYVLEHHRPELESNSYARLYAAAFAGSAPLP